MPPQPDSFAGPAEAVVMRIEGEEIVIYENYEVTVSVLNQPAAFSLRLGWGKTLEALRQKCQPGKKFQLFIGTLDEKGDRHLVQVQSGRLDRRAIPSASASVLEVKGRDYLAQVFDSYILEERAFSERTYFNLTRKVLDTVGLKDHDLLADNDSNRALITSTKKTRKSKNTIAIDQIETGATSGGGKVVYQTLKAKLGTSWYQFLKDQYKLAGLFLWCTGEGDFVLGRPHATTPSVFKIKRQRNSTRNVVNVIDADYSDDTTMRHSRAIVYGRAGGTKAGRKKIRGEYIDAEMVAYGFDKPIVVHDDDVKNQKQADYVARRIIAEERREGWHLDYTIPGHTIPSPYAKGAVAVWGQDFVCHVDDDELEINKEYYIESVTFSRKPETTTKISLMRKEDLVFAENLF